MRVTKRIRKFEHASDSLRDSLCRNILDLQGSLTSVAEMKTFLLWCDENLQGIYYYHGTDSYMMFEHSSDMNLCILRGNKDVVT
jgi:hypothetical protein